MQKLLIVPGLRQLIRKQFHRLNRRQRIQNLAQNPRPLQVFLRNQQLFLTSSGTLNVDRREHALIHQLAIQNHFHVASSLELFEDHFVHARAGIDKRSSNDRQRTALFDVASSTEEALRPLQRIRVNTAREHLARRRNNRVVSTRQTRNRVKQNHYIALMLHQTLRLLNHHLGNLYVTRSRLIERGRDNLALHAALHIRNFFRTLVDQQHDQHDLRMICSNAVRNRLQQHRLTSPRRSHNQPTLPLAHRSQQVHHAPRDVLANRLHLHPLLRIQRSQIVEQDLVPRLFRRLEVDRLDLHQREVLLALMRRTHIAADRIAGL